MGIAHGDSDTTEKLESCSGGGWVVGGGRGRVVSDLGWLNCEVIGAPGVSPIAKILEMSIRLSAAVGGGEEEEERGGGVRASDVNGTVRSLFIVVVSKS